MFQPRKWWIGLPVLLGLWIVAGAFSVGSVEGDLAARSGAALATLALDKPAATFAGRDGVVSAEAFTPQDQPGAAQKVEETFGVRLVENRTQLAPTVTPYSFSAAKTADRIVLSGSVPNPRTRADIAGKAQSALPGAAIVDNAAYGLGAPQDLVAFADYGLKELAKLATGAAVVKDAELSMNGVAPTSANYSQVLADLKSPPDGLKLGAIDVKPPEAKDVVWDAVAGGGALSLTGFVANEDMRAAIVAAAKKALPGVEITDRLAYASNAPASLTDLAAFAFDRFAQLKEGEATLKGGIFSFTGAAPDAAAHDAVQAAFQGLSLQGVTISPPNLTTLATAAPPAPTTATAPNAAASGPTFSAVRDSDVGVLELNGAYPDEKSHQELIATVKRAFFSDKITDNMHLDPGAPQLPPDVAHAALGQLARLVSGKLEISGKTISFSGDALYDLAANQIKTTLETGLPAGYSAQTNVGVHKAADAVDAPACQRLFSDLMTRGHILFETGKANIDRDSAGVLDFVVATALRCSSNQVEVDGHTDTDGQAEANMALSKQRAEAVVEYLARAGIDRSRLSATGYGQTRPVASNATEEGKAQNRRIEFLVK
jgi:OOP family OmpA-OmpF porin